MTWIDEPLLVLDMESDSPDPCMAMPVQICVGMSAEPGHWEPHTWLVRPERPIPAEATAVHGITTEHATAYGQPLAQVLDEIWGMVDGSGVPVVVHNAPYDMTIMHRLYGTDWSSLSPAVLDTLVLHWRFDRRTGGRTLGALAARAGIEFQAHDAEADSLVTLRLLHILCSADDALPHIPVDALQILQARWHSQRVEQIAARAAGDGRTIDTDRAWPWR